jgi:hypothetical protein
MTTHIPLEKAVIAAGLKFLNGLPRTYARKTIGGRYGSGWPDLIVCCKGRLLALEAKRPLVGKVTKLQHAELKRWRRAGAVADVFRSVDDLADILIGHDLFTAPELGHNPP